ncbi:hypothetical protein F4680DRAFT_464294 [Xylaria scruposa]|nr:hypothetical protein F4680DRAFT_464294 [Xylaria scruposa]
MARSLRDTYPYINGHGEVTPVIDKADNSVVETSDFTALPPPTPKPGQPTVQFMDLPLEIREIIWNLSLPGPRELCKPIGTASTSTSHYRDWYFERNRTDFDMPLSRVCSESRRIMLKAGYKLDNEYKLGPYFQNGFFFTNSVNPGFPSVGVWYCKERGDTTSLCFC